MTVRSVYSELLKCEPRNHLDTLTGDFEKRVSYHNRTGKPVRVTYRTGLSYILESEAITGFRVFSVEVEWCMSKNVRDQLVNQLNSVDHRGNKGLYALKRMVEENGFRQVGTKYYLNMEYRTRLEDIGPSGVYVANADIMLSKSDSTFNIIHPYSEEGLMIKAARDAKRLEDYRSRGMYKDLMSISFEVIDSSPRPFPRYYRIGLNIMEVFPKPSTESKQDGLYVYFHETGDVHYISLDDKEHLNRYGVFDTRAEAEMSNADMVEMEIKRLKYELEREQYKNKKSLLRIEQENEAEKLETTRRREDMRDYYEERSYQRKDENEMLKALPTLIVGLGGVFMAMKALK